MSNNAAIIIPFRDSFGNGERYIELQKLSQKIEIICTAHSQPYEIFVIHQKDDLLFNKAYLMNIGASIALDSCDYFVFHDVDHVPAEDSNIYGPREFSGCLVHKGQEVFQDDSTYFGGVIYIKKEDYLAINGFCNHFWGWGWEDSAILDRLNSAGIPTKRGREKFMLHAHETKHRWNGNINLVNNTIILKLINTQINDGYSNLAYELLETSRPNTHTTIYDVKIPPPQYDTDVILDEAKIAEIGGIYDESVVRQLIATYSK